MILGLDSCCGGWDALDVWPVLCYLVCYVWIVTCVGADTVAHDKHLELQHYLIWFLALSVSKTSTSFSQFQLMSRRLTEMLQKSTCSLRIACNISPRMPLPNKSFEMGSQGCNWNAPKMPKILCVTCNKCHKPIVKWPF